MKSKVQFQVMMAPVTGSEFHATSLWRCSFLGQIVSLEGFNEDNLYLEYSLNAASGWITREKQESGFSWKTRPNDKDICHLSLPFDIDLFHELSDSSSLDLQWPKLVFTVRAIDRYNRETVCGVGSIILPRKPGHHSITITTVKRVPVSLLDNMSQYFLGFIEEDEDGKDDDKDCSPESKSLMTESSGKVVLSLYCMVRSEESIEAQKKHRADLILSIQQVIQAFEKAKNKMMQVSKIVQQDEKERQELRDTQEDSSSDDEETEEQQTLSKQSSNQLESLEEEDESDTSFSEE